jgi:pimeloyl-ACP methyl ester carboxylesterase
VRIQLVVGSLEEIMYANHNRSQQHHGRDSVPPCEERDLRVSPFWQRTGASAAFFQHFTGTLDNWDWAVTDPLASGREVILFDNAGVGRSTGSVPTTVAGMAAHALDFLDGVGLDDCDVLGLSLGGMIAQDMVLDRPSIFRRMILVGTTPRGGDDIMHLEKPSLAKHLDDPSLKGYAVLQKLFFAPTASSQAAGARFIERLGQRKGDLDAPSGPEIATAQITAFREWEQPRGTRFGDLKRIHQPTLVVNGIHDEMIPLVNCYRLVENLPTRAFTFTLPAAAAVITAPP